MKQWKNDHFELASGRNSKNISEISLLYFIVPV